MDLEDLDFLFETPIKSYKQSKKDFKKLIFEIKGIEEQADGKLIFDNYHVNGDALLVKIKNMNKALKKNALHTTTIQSTRRNYEEDGSINHIAKKDEMMEQVDMFVQCFNQLSEDHRLIVYYSFYKDKQNEAIAQKLFISERTVRIEKKKAIEAMQAYQSKLSLMKELKLIKSGSIGSGFSCDQNSERNR